MVQSYDGRNSFGFGVLMAVKAPTVFAVTGDQELVRRRFLNGILQDWKIRGCKIEHVDASIEGELSRAMVPAGTLFDISDQKVILVVENPNKVDSDFLKGHASDLDSDITLVLDLPGEPDGRTKFGKFVKSLGKRD